MRIKTENLKELILVWPPILFVATVAVLAAMAGWGWLEDRCDEWVDAMKGKK